MKRSEILRILDANFNRSREGLRVCEEITRFVLEDEDSTRSLKKIRHAISDCLRKLPVAVKELVDSRNASDDVGRKSTAPERKRNSFSGLFLANMQRSKEALRVLEEMTKLIDAKSSDRLKKIRFRAYAVEKEVIQELEALRHNGS